MLARTEDLAVLQRLNIAIGRRLRTVRRAKKLSQQDAGAVLGISFQQIQKYENGANRISAASLVMLCARLDLDPAEFLAALTPSASPADRAHADWLCSQPARIAAVLFSPLPEHVQTRLLDAMAALVLAARRDAGEQP